MMATPSLPWMIWKTLFNGYASCVKNIHLIPTSGTCGATGKTPKLNCLPASMMGLMSSIVWIAWSLRMRPFPCGLPAIWLPSSLSLKSWGSGWQTTSQSPAAMSKIMAGLKRPSGKHTKLCPNINMLCAVTSKVIMLQFVLTC